MLTDTLILGGGLAGAAAALWLADHGHTATIIEARPRLGGRALSRDWQGSGPVEYGGGWIRKDHTTLLSLAKRLAIPLSLRARVTGHTYFRNGTANPHPAEDMAEYNAALSRLQADAAALVSRTPEAEAIAAMSFEAYITHRNHPAALRRELLAWWSMSGSGDPSAIAVSELLTPKLAKGLLIKLEELAFTLTPGISALIEAAAKASQAQVILSNPALSLTDHHSHVEATLTSGRIVKARTALIALNLNAYAQIRFTPSLNPAQQTLCHKGHAGRAIKLLIRAKGPEAGHLATGEAQGLRWIYADRILPDGTTLLIAFGLYDETGDPTQTQIAHAVAAAFPGAELIGFDWHDWCADPFSRGTWVSPSLATLPDYDPSHWAPRGNLAFAGSDLYSAEQGWFEGALLSAEHATKSLHHRLTESLTESPPS